MYEAVLRSRPDHTVARSRLERLDRRLAAERRAREVLEGQGLAALWRNGLAAKEERRDPLFALAAIELVSAAVPHDRTVKLALASAYRMDRRPGDAGRIVDELIEANPSMRDNMAAFVVRAAVLRDKRLLETARRLYERLREIDPGNPAVQRGLAAVHADLRSQRGLGRAA
jgi:tetratricopeptide (TPR) repeat protein